jgi:hypothetical protein
MQAPVGLTPSGVNSAKLRQQRAGQMMSCDKGCGPSCKLCEGPGVTKTDVRTPSDLNSVTSDCDQVFIDLSSARSMHSKRTQHALTVHTAQRPEVARSHNLGLS